MRVGGVGENRNVVVTAAAGWAGSASVTVTVSDANGAVAESTFAVTAPAAVPPTVPPTSPSVNPPASTAPLLIGGSPNGAATTFVIASGRLQPAESVAFPGLSGSIRTASADVSGDGVPDLIGASAPGVPARVVVLDGRTRAVLADFLPYGSGYTGGLFVAAADGPTGPRTALRSSARTYRTRSGRC